MRRRPTVILAWAAATVMACAGCAAATTHHASARAVNGEATIAYLRAREAVLRSATADLSADQREAGEFVVRARTECGGLLRGQGSAVTMRHVPAGPITRWSAQQLALVERANYLATLLTEDLEAAQSRSHGAAVRRFAASVEALRWDDPQMTALAHTFARIELLRLNAPPPDICRPLKEWVASGYTKMPSLVPPQSEGTLGVEWRRDAAALGCGRYTEVTAKEMIRALTPFQRPGASPNIRRIALLELRASVAESGATRGAMQSLRGALGLPRGRVLRSKHRFPRSELEAPPAAGGCTVKRDPA